MFQLNSAGNGIFENTVAVKGQMIVGSSNNPQAGAALEILSTTGALLLPRLSDAQEGGVTGVNGMMYYNTIDNAVKAYVGGNWKAVVVA